jgi:hypothetical protein
MNLRKAADMRVIQMTGPLDYPSGIPTRHIIAATLDLALAVFRQHHPGVGVRAVYCYGTTYVFEMEVKE